MRSSALPRSPGVLEWCTTKVLVYMSLTVTSQKSRISLSVDALCPGTFFSPSEINVTDGVYFLFKKLRLSKIGNLFCDKTTFRHGCGSLGEMLLPHWKRKLLHLLSSKCVYVALKSWTFQACFKTNSSPNPPSAPALSSPPKASKLPIVATCA